MATLPEIIMVTWTIPCLKGKNGHPKGAFVTSMIVSGSAPFKSWLIVVHLTGHSGEVRHRSLRLNEVAVDTAPCCPWKR